MRKWIDIFALVMAGVVMPVGAVIVAFVVSRGNAVESTPPPAPPTTTVTTPPTSTGTQQVPSQ